MAEVKVGIAADLTAYENALAQMEGVTEERLAAVRKVAEDARVFDALVEQVQKATGVSESTAKRLVKADLAAQKQMRAEAEKTAEARARAEEAAAASAQRARLLEVMATEKAEAQKRDAIKKGATVAFGGIVGDIEDVVGALAAMGPAAVAAGAALGGIAIVAGAAWAEVQVVSYLYDAASATGNLAEEQKALASALEAVNLVIGERVSPTFEGLMLGAIEAALQIKELASKFIVARDAAIDWYNGMNPVLQFLASPFLLPLAAGSRLDQISEALKEGSPRAKAYIAQMQALEKADAARNAALKQAAENERVFDSMEREIDADKKRRRAEHAAAVKKQHDAETQLRQKSLDEERRYQEELANIRGRQFLQDMEDDQELSDQILGTIGEIQDSQRKTADKYIKTTDDKIAKIQQEKDARIAFDRQTVASGVSAAATLAQAISDGAEEGSKVQKDAAMVAFRINQAQALASIAISTAEGITKAAAIYPPAGPTAVVFGLAAGALTAIGLAQAAAVAAQEPPTFHRGGMISTNPLAPDEAMVRARKGEEIRTRQQQNSGSPVVVQMVYQHRIFDSFVADNLNQAGSPLRRGLQAAGGRMLGHRGAR